MDASRGAVEAQLEELKEKLLAPIVRSAGNTMLVSELRWVANEAAALAWFTVCPILVLPLLLEEKIRAALERWERQHQLLECRVRSAEGGMRTSRGMHRLQRLCEKPEHTPNAIGTRTSVRRASRQP
jgi:hypothetical protein